MGIKYNILSVPHNIHTQDVIYIYIYEMHYITDDVYIICYILHIYIYSIYTYRYTFTPIMEYIYIYVYRARDGVRNGGLGLAVS